MRRCAFSSVPRPSKTGQGTYQGISSDQCRKDQDMPEVHVFYQSLSCFSHASIVSSFYPPQTFSGVLIIVTPANAQPPACSSVSSSSLASCEETGCSRWTVQLLPTQKQGRSWVSLDSHRLGEAEFSTTTSFKLPGMLRIFMQESGANSCKPINGYRSMSLLFSDHRQRTISMPSSTSGAGVATFDHKARDTTWYNCISISWTDKAFPL